jgi:3-oxoacyl-[acyl-carrier protein] reductase
VGKAGSSVIILTGASGGLGRAILPLLASLDTVVALYHTNPPEVAADTGITSRQLDLSSEEAVKAFCSDLKPKLKRVALLHAAALSRDALAAQLDTKVWDRILDVNLRGNFLLTRELLMVMIQQHWGRIIHFSSVAGLTGMRGTLAYSATKTGLLGMSRVLAREYARFGITSNVITLGYFDTGLIDTVSVKVKKKVLEDIPSGKLGKPGNIVHAVEFLIKSDYTNGSVLRIDGGI